MRLIDADALLENQPSCCRTLDWINAAPTVDAIPVEWMGQKIREEGEYGNMLKAEYIKELIWEWHQEEEE